MFILIPLGVAMVTMLTHKYEVQKRVNRAAIQEEKAKREQLILEKQQTLASKKNLLAGLKKLKTDKATTKEAARQALLNNDKTDDAMAQATLAQITKEEAIDQGKLDAEILALEKETRLEELAIRDLKAQQAQSSLQELQNQSGILSIFGNILGILTPVFMMMQLINGAQALFIRLKKKEVGASAAAASAAGTEAAVKTTGMFAGIVKAFSQGGIPGVIAGIALATGLALALGFAIAGAVGAFNVKDEAEDDAKHINELSNQIYKLQEKANAIDQITSSFDSLDGKIIKTSKDIEEMNSLLDQAADKLSDEVEDDENIGYGKGVSEKEHYQSLGSDKAKREFLEQVEKEARDEAAAKRREQINLFRSNPELLNENTTNNEIKKAQSSLYANATYNLQNYIDKLKDTKKITNEVASSVEKMTQAILDESNLQQAFSFAGSPSKVAALVDKIKDLTINAENVNGELEEISTADILTSDDYGITTKVEAFKQLKETLGEGTESYKLFTSAYQEYAVFAEMSEDVLKMIDNLEISIEDINKLGES